MHAEVKWVWCDQRPIRKRMQDRQEKSLLELTRLSEKGSESGGRFVLVLLKAVWILLVQELKVGKRRETGEVLKRHES